MLADMDLIQSWFVPVLGSEVSWNSRLGGGGWGFAGLAKGVGGGLPGQGGWTWLLLGRASSLPPLSLPHIVAA